MANRVFSKGATGVLQDLINLQMDNVKVAAIRTYTYNDAHATLADIVTAGGSIVVKSAALANKSFVNRVFDADDTSLTMTAGTDSILVIYSEFGNSTANGSGMLLGYYDDAPGIPIPGTTTGSVPIVWPSTGILTLI